MQHRILIVDDQLHWQYGLLEDAESSGLVKFVRCTDSTKLPKGWLDTLCALLDYKMPVLNGDKLAHQMRAQGYTGPIYDIGAFAGGQWPMDTVRVGKKLSMPVLRAIIQHTQNQLSTDDLYAIVHGY